MASAWTGVRIVELGGLQTLYGSKLFADQGAEVVLVEPEGGHESRRLPPFAPGPLDQTASIPFTYLNGNKKSVLLPLGSPAAEEPLERLLRGANVVFAGGRPSELRALGVSPEQLAELAPAAVLATVTPFGWTGPWTERPVDELGLYAAGGFLSLGGYANGRPLQPPAGQAYVAAGMFAAVGVAAALQRPGMGGGHIDVSIQESVVMALENAAQFYELEGRVRGRSGGTELQVGRGVYRCKDGYVYLMLGLHAGSKFWRKLLVWLEDEGVADRERLAGERWTERAFAESDEGKEIFNEVFGAFADARNKVELYAAARERGIPLAPVNTMTDVMEDEQIRARKFLVDVDAADWSHGPAVAPGAPYRMSATPWQGAYAPRALGADNELLDWAPAAPEGVA